MKPGATASIFGDSIRYIIFVTTKEKMIWVTTLSVITFV